MTFKCQDFSRFSIFLFFIVQASKRHGTLQSKNGYIFVNSLEREERIWKVDNVYLYLEWCMDDYIDFRMGLLSIYYNDKI